MLRRLFTFIIAGILSLTSAAQTTYNMSTLTVTDCEGILLDSDAGQLPDYYDHNEDLVFTICIAASDSILMTFGQFCTEAGFDILTIHDGPNTASPVIGTFSGTISIPPVMATSGCMTLHFVTDANVACTGWQAAWTTFISPPDDPVFSFNPSMPTCSTAAVVATFTQPIPCDSVYPAAFEITAPVDQTITSITPLNCVNGIATQFQMQLSPGLDQSGTYGFHFTYHFTDACFNEYTLYADTSLAVNDCPLQVEVVTESEWICPGTCTQITANVTGGNPGTYTYNWSNGLPNSAGPHWVCPISNTTYTVTVDDVGPASAATASTAINLLVSPVAQADFSMCQNDAPVNLTATPAGGWWWPAGGVTDPSGIFDPDTSGAGIHWAYYIAPNGCVDSVQITVLDINAGYDEVACPGTAAFQLIDFTPAGGTWSGSGITSGGVFNPASAGTYTVTYSAPNGCTDTKDINVANLVLPAVDTVCQSAAAFTLAFSPYGGLWSGSTGLTDPFSGNFNPANANPGSNVLTYTANGCSAQTEVFVKAINAGNDFASCPQQAPFQLTGFSPSGGTWTGTGITNPSGMFNPGINGGNFNSTLTYTLDGCTDQRIAYVIQTAITIPVLEFCPDADNILLNNDNTGRTPGGGNWTGTGVISPFAPGEFSPSTAGAGTYTLTYTVNTCSATLTAIVHPFPTVNDTAVCELSGAFPLHATPVGGTWDGDGVDNNTFDPQATGLGNFPLTYTSPDGCESAANVNVYELAPAELSGLELFYCYSDTNILLTGEPVGGIFSGAGVNDTVFNPSVAGAGTHTITYNFGGGNCLVTDDASVIVGAAIQPVVTISEDTLCIGQYTTISVSATGGDGSFTYQWLNNNGLGTSITVSPDTTSYYVMYIEDGCSDPVTDSIAVTVQPAFHATITTGPEECYNQPVQVSATASLPGNYVYHWDTSPPQSGDTINAPAGRDVQLTLTNTATGCHIDTTFDVPGFEFLQARFSLNPNLLCLPLADATAFFTDLSTGADTGVWNFGDGATLPFSPGVYPEHSYADTGHYNASLIVMNEGNCTDTFNMVVCVYPDYKLFIPTAFTPNGDGINDIFKAEGIGIHELHMEIFNHWGERMYYIDSVDDSWDGTFRGELVPQGVYVWYAHVSVLIPQGRKFLRLTGMLDVLPGKH